MKDKGIFIMSLDLELFWGVRDVTTKEAYGESVANVHSLFPRMLDIYKEYGLRATFATVGFLMAKNKNELVAFSPKVKPRYTDINLSPYEENFRSIKDEPENDPYHYGLNLIQLLKDNPEHEIATHTFSHFYCLEPGQTVKDFKLDLKAALDIANNNGISMQSIIFPRNQVHTDYVNVCKELGIKSFRGGADNIWFLIPGPENNTRLTTKVMRTLDCYVNIGGHQCYSLNNIIKEKPYNIKSSRFYRPYKKKGGAILESFKINRIKKSMTYAAKNKLIYHLWWHPHNFGSNTDKNLASLRNIFEHYKYLSHKYDFQNNTMMEVSNMLETSTISKQ